jgi:hypothetical protein
MLWNIALYWIHQNGREQPFIAESVFAESCFPRLRSELKIAVLRYWIELFCFSTCGTHWEKVNIHSSGCAPSRERYNEIPGGGTMEKHNARLDQWVDCGYYKPPGLHSFLAILLVENDTRTAASFAVLGNAIFMT